jgi:hypothetical protein
MKIYTELKPFIEYISSIRKMDTYLSLDFSFPKEWVIPKSYVDETKVVSFQTDSQNFKGISFITKTNSEIDTTFLNIKNIINFNKERELKESLFKKKVEQLKKTFETTDLDKLKKLDFKFQEETTINSKEEISNGSERKNVEMVGEGESQGQSGN